jgi:hypothetical protein
MSENKVWDMRHKPGYEFRKHQQSPKIVAFQEKSF